MDWAQTTNMYPKGQKGSSAGFFVQPHCTCCEMELYSVVTVWTIMQHTGWLSKCRFKCSLPSVAAFLPGMATSITMKEGGKVNPSGNFVGDLEIECFQNCSKRQRARACLSLSLASCLCCFSTRDLTLRIFTLLPSSAISICSTLLDLYPSQSKILLKLPVLAATWKQNSAVAAAAMGGFN